ncbi:hypothetical protein LDC_1164, partial [sediment metagenome]
MIYGTPGGLPADVMIPQAFGTHALGIVGESAQGSGFGFLTTGLSGFYTTPAGASTLIASAPWYATNQGRVYAFSGHGPSATTLGVGDATQMVQGEASQYYGLASLQTLRNLPGLPTPTTVFGLPFYGSGRVHVRNGTTANGPFAQ